MNVLAGILLLLSTLWTLLLAAGALASALYNDGLLDVVSDQQVTALLLYAGAVAGNMGALNGNLEPFGGDSQLLLFLVAGVLAIISPLQVMAAINAFRNKGRTLLAIGALCPLAMGVIQFAGGWLITSLPGLLAGLFGLLAASKLGQDVPVAEPTEDEPIQEKKGLDLGKLFKRKPKDPDDEVHASTDEPSAEQPSDGGGKPGLGALFKRSEKKSKPRKVSASPPMDNTEKALAGLFALGVLSLLAYAFFRLLDIGAL